MLKGALHKSMKACTPERFGEGVSVPSHKFQLLHCRFRISKLAFWKIIRTLEPLFTHLLYQFLNQHVLQIAHLPKRTATPFSAIRQVFVLSFPFGLTNLLVFVNA
jgi:hypothetical protein